VPSILFGANAVNMKLSRVEKYLRSQEGLEVAGEHVLNRTAAAFRRGYDPVTKQPWKRLRPNTVTGRRGQSSKPLLDRGLLRASFNRGGRQNIWKFRGSDALIIGSSSKKAVFHNEGTKGPYKIRKKRKKSLRFPVAGKTEAPRDAGGFWAFAREVTHPGLPRRRMLGLSRGMSIMISKMIAEDLDGRMEG